MKKNKLYCIIVLLMFSYLGTSQEYQHLTIASGFNADVIANGTGSALTSTNNGLDAVNFSLMSNDFLPPGATNTPSYALPSSGLLSNAATPGITYQLTSFSANNTLRIPNQNNSGTLSFSSPVKATKLFALVTSGSGTSTISAVITFDDATTQPISNTIIPDWFNSTSLPVVISGIGRVNRLNDNIENPSGNPRLYQWEMNILPANQDKLITSVQFTKTSVAEGVFNIFAITAEILPDCPSPTNLTAISGADNAEIQWTTPVINPQEGYQYFFSTTNTPPDESTTPTGTIPAGTTSLTLSDLMIGQEYYIWVRSDCDDDGFSNWAGTTFTTGQMSATYTDGDIETLYNTNVMLTSPNTCPGQMTLSVPEGFEISSVSVAYSMTAQGGAWQSEQRSLLSCITTSTAENTLTTGPSINSAGTANYNRTGLNIANGATGNVTFELKAWRTWGGSDCNTTYNKVDNNSWSITITYQPIPCEISEPYGDDQTFCEGATVENLVATGEEDSVFHWYAHPDDTAYLESDTLLETGTYYVSQVFDDCESSKVSIDVTIIQAPEPPSGDAIQEFTEGETISSLIIDSIEGAEINWYILNDDNEWIPQDSNTLLTDQTTYYVSQTIDDCESDFFAITAIETLSRTSLLSQDFKIYPNPAYMIITIEHSTINYNISIYDATGKKIKQSHSNTRITQLDISNLAMGIYWLQIEDSQLIGKTVKLLKQ